MGETSQTETAKGDWVIDFTYKSIPKKNGRIEEYDRCLRQPLTKSGRRDEEQNTFDSEPVPSHSAQYLMEEKNAVERSFSNRSVIESIRRDEGETYDASITTSCASAIFLIKEKEALEKSSAETCIIESPRPVKSFCEFKPETPSDSPDTSATISEKVYLHISPKPMDTGRHTVELSFSYNPESGEWNARIVTSVNHDAVSKKSMWNLN